MALGKVKVLRRVSALCQDFRPTRESQGPGQARSARLPPRPPAPGFQPPPQADREGWDLAAGKRRPFLSPTH